MNTEIARREETGEELLQGWTPAALRAQIAREKELRSIIIEYYQSCMVEGHHYYRLDDDEKKKPALTKEGALALCHLFKAHPHPEPPVETWASDGHYGVRSSVSIIERISREIIAEGVGYCSTRESKYAYRLGARACPKCGKAAIIKGREEFGGGWLCFRKKDGCGAKFKDGDAEIESQPTGRVPNEDIADQYNTTLKMSHKRAMVDAALAIPLVSEIFTQDLEEQIEDRQRAIAGEAPTESRTEERVTKSPQEPPRAQIRTEAPESSGSKPTAPEVEDLLIFLGQAYQSDERAWAKVREVMNIPAGQDFTRARVRLQLTRAQHDHLKAAAEQALKDELKSAHPDDAVGDFSAPDGSISPQERAQTSDESPSGSDPSGANQEATSSPIDHAPATDTSDAAMSGPDQTPAPESAGTAGGTGHEGKYASQAQKDELKALASQISPDEAETVRKSIDRHRHGLPLEIYEMARTRLKTRLAQEAATEA